MLLVEIGGGPRLIAQLRAPEGVEVGIGSAVHVEWENYEQQSLPVFVPDE